MSKSLLLISPDVSVCEMMHWVGRDTFDQDVLLHVHLQGHVRLGQNLGLLAFDHTKEHLEVAQLSIEEKDFKEPCCDLKGTLLDQKSHKVAHKGAMDHQRVLL